MVEAQAKSRSSVPKKLIQRQNKKQGRLELENVAKEFLGKRTAILLNNLEIMLEEFGTVCGTTNGLTGSVSYSETYDKIKNYQRRPQNI